jgi:4-amino-4-deoxy-L-arabinose transferase-like glycosyltransferase
MTSNGYLILILAVALSMGIAYVLAFNPQNTPRFMEKMDRLMFHARKLFLIILLGIIAIPPIWIVQDRWLEYPIGIQSTDLLWWNRLLSLPLSYPRYFLGAWVLLVSTWLIVFFTMRSSGLQMASHSIESKVKNDETNKKFQNVGRMLIWFALGTALISAGVSIFTGRIPGWELLLALAIYCCGWLIHEYGMDKPRQFFLQHGGFMFDTAIFVISFCGVLYALFGETQSSFIFYVIFICAAINLYRNKRILPLVFWISMASLAALTWKIDSWEYVVIGDEYSFYEAVRTVLENRSLWSLINTTFEGSFVFGAHPYFSSYIQFFFMKIFGYLNFGWRFSNPFLVAFSLFFFYYFFEYFTSRRTAIITTILLGFSHYLLSFTKIGYNNLQALFALGLVLAALAWSLKSLKLISFTCLGLAMGFCFYVYPAALYIVPLPILGLLIHLPPVDRPALKRWGWALLSCLLLIYPLLMQPKYWQEKIPGTFLSDESQIPVERSFENIVSNTIYSMFSYLYIPQESHYVSTGYLDPLSGAFVVLGSAVLVGSMFKRNKSALFLFLSFLSFLILVGATHGRSFPTTTRMFLLLPWFVLFASLGMEWILDRFSVLFKINNPLLPITLLAAVIVLNFYEAYSVDISRSAQYHNTQSLFIKIVREIRDRGDVPAKTFYFVTEPHWNTQAILIHQWVYGLPESPDQVVAINLENDQFPAGMEAIVKERNNIIIIRVSVNRDILTDLDKQLTAWGKSMCVIKNQRGVEKFQFWHSEDLHWICERER